MSSTVPRRCFLGLGSNLGDRLGYLERATTLLATHGDVVAVSSLYETEPVGGPEQGPYLNAVVELCTKDSARDLLDRCQRVEQDAGRVRTVRFGARTLDADVLIVGDERINESDLIVPHPRMYQRRFVLAPLHDLAPELVSAEAMASAVGVVECVGKMTWLGTRVTKHDR